MIKRILFLLLNFNLATSMVGQVFAQGGDQIPSSGGDQIPSNSGCDPSQSFCIEPPTRFDSIWGLLEEIAKWVTSIAAAIATIMILVGAYQILFAAGNPEKLETGKKTILYTVIAYAILLLSWGIVSIIQKFLGTQ